MVDGRIVVDHGELTTLDEGSILAELAERRPQLHAWQDELERLNKAFVPAFTTMHERAQARDLGFTRYLG